MEASPVGVGGVMLGGDAEVGRDPAPSCCLTGWGNLTQHLGQVGFRQAKGCDTCWRGFAKKFRRRPLADVWAAAQKPFFFFSFFFLC